MNSRGISGVRFVPISFKPNASKYQNEVCGGVNIVVLDRNALDAPLLGVELASALRMLYPNDFKTDRLMHIIGNQATVDAILAGIDPRRIAEDWRDSLEQFQQIRKKYLLY